MLDRKTIFNVVYAVALFELISTVVTLAYSFLAYLFTWQFDEPDWWGVIFMVTFVLTLVAAVVFFAVLRLIGKRLIPSLYEYIILLAVAVICLFIPLCVKENYVLNAAVSAISIATLPCVAAILAFNFIDDKLAAKGAADAAPTEEAPTEEAPAEDTPVADDAPTAE